jgi:GTP-binding protein
VHLQSAWVFDPQLEVPSCLGINALVLDLDRVPPEAAAGAPDGPLGLPCVRQLCMLIASGGAAGYGNPHFLSTRNPSPKFATRGYEGERVSAGPRS